MSLIKSCPDCEKPLEASAQVCTHCGADLTVGGQGTDIWLGLQRRLAEATADRYEIEGLIGYGGMAGVYLARDMNLSRHVALKLISPAVVMDPRMVRRFFHEAQTMAQLSHRHIVPIYDIHERDDLVYMVMKYVPGRTLAEVLADTESPLPPELVSTWMAQIAGALAHAHSRQTSVIHRDIKPSNILLDENGEALLTDFGIAKIQGESNLTRTGHLIGTPAYMSPEQCVGRDLTPASDQYSLGTVAFELLAGSPPFKGPTLMVLQAHSSMEPPRLAEKRTDCPPQLAGIVQKMLAKSPEDRWPSMSALAEEFSRAVGRPIPPAEMAAWSRRVHHLDIPSGPGHVTLGTSERLQATVLDRQGREIGGRKVRWSSTNEEVAVVSPDGVVAARGVGSAVIVARSGQAVTTLEVEVRAAGVGHISVSPPSVELYTGETKPLSATCYSTTGDPVDTRAEFRSERPDVVSVTAEGMLEALSPGETMVVVSAEGMSQPVPVRIMAAPVASIAFPISSCELNPGESQVVPVVVLGRDGRTQPNPAVWWTSSDESVAQVSGSGVVTAIGAGEALLTASAGDKTASLRVAVAPAMTAGGPSQLTVADAPTTPPPAPPPAPPRDRAPGATVLFEGVDAPVDPRGGTAPPEYGTSTAGSARTGGIPPGVAGLPGAGADPRDPAGDADGPLDLIKRPVIWVPATAAVGVLIAVAVLWPSETGVSATVFPADTTIFVGESFQAQLSSDGGSASSLPMQWRSSDIAIAAVSSEGFVMARAPGMASITVRGRGAEVSPGRITVLPRPIETTEATDTTAPPDDPPIPPETRITYRDVVIEGVPAQVTRGVTVRPTAWLIDQDSQRHRGTSLSWVSTNPGVLQQTGPGTFRAEAAGEATLRVSSANTTARGFVTVTVVAPETRTVDPPDTPPDDGPDNPPPPEPVASAVRISPSGAELQVAETRDLTAAVFDQFGNAMGGVATQWVSRDPSVASVTASGRVSAAGAGATQIVASATGLVDSVLVRVTSPGASDDDGRQAANRYLELFRTEQDGTLRGLASGTIGANHQEFLEEVRRGRLEPTGSVTGLAVDGETISFSIPVRHTTGFGTRRTGSLAFVGRLELVDGAWQLTSCVLAPGSSLDDLN